MKYDIPSEAIPYPNIYSIILVLISVDAGRIPGLHRYPVSAPQIEDAKRALTCASKMGWLFH
jgi:hypothetical protein